MKNNPSIIHAFLILATLMLLPSCGQSPEDKRQDAIRSANFYLTSRQCDNAIRVLEEAGRDALDATYMRTLSSAYACKGNFDAIELFATDLALFADPAPIGGSTRFSTSPDMTSPTDAEFVQLQTAIDILLYAGNIGTDEEPTVATRAGLFNTVDAAEINMQLVYMLMVQIGRYLKFYGNASAAGVKGAGAGTNQCFIRYENLAIQGGPPNDLAAYFTATSPTLTGACSGANFDQPTQGHAAFGAPGSYNIERMCQGVVIINAFFNIFPAILSNISGTDFPWVSNVNTIITTAKSAMEVAKPGTLAKVGNVLSQENCEALNAADDDFLQIYFAFMMENLFK